MSDCEGVSASVSKCYSAFEWLWVRVQVYECESEWVWVSVGLIDCGKVRVSDCKWVWASLQKCVCSQVASNQHFTACYNFDT